MLTAYAMNDRIAILQNAIEETWQVFGAGLIEADPAEQMICGLEHRIILEMIERPLPIADRPDRTAHCAARDVRKIPGRK
jgi:hypothetical protein